MAPHTGTRPNQWPKIRNMCIINRGRYRHYYDISLCKHSGIVGVYRMGG